MTSPPPPKLTPYNVPPELLDIILAHVPPASLAPLLRVNSAFYLATKPHLFRTVHLSPSPAARSQLLHVSGPDHALTDIDAPGAFGSRSGDSFRPLFRTAWLTAHTHTLKVDAHGPEGCTAFVQSVPPLPRLRVLRTPFDTHNVFADPTARAEDYAPCKCLELSFDTLVHDHVFWSWRSMQRLAPPPSLHLKTHVLVFDNNVQGHPNAGDDFFDSPWITRMTFPRSTLHGWTEHHRTPPISDHLVGVLPIITTPPSHDDTEAMVHALLQLATRVVCDRRRRFTSIGGLMDVRSVGIPTVAWWGLHELSGRELSGETACARDVVRPILSSISRLILEDEAARGMITLPEGEEREAAIAQYIKDDIAGVTFKSLDEVVSSGELEDILTPKELRRLVMGVNEAAKRRGGRKRAPTV